MDKVGVLFWKRFSVIVLISVIIGVFVGNYYSWMLGICSYVCVQWFTLPVLFRMTMND